jgi:hypothetical protein
MVKGLVADVNIEGHVRFLLDILHNEEWRDTWASLHLMTPTFAEIGLCRESPDSEVWKTCQREGLLLITGNRSAEGPDSLEQTIRSLNHLAALPVITLADLDRILHERRYAERDAVRILEIVLEIDQFRGAGRLFVPSPP